MTLSKLRPGDKLKGYPAEMHNAVVDLVSQPSSIPSNAIHDPPEKSFWVWWKNDGYVSVLRGMACMLGDSLHDLTGEDNANEDQRKNYARDFDSFAIYEEATGRNVKPNGSHRTFFDTDYDPRNYNAGSSSEPNILADHAWNNWGFAIDNIPPGKWGRVGIMGVFYVPLRVRHPAMHFCHAYQSGASAGASNGGVAHWATTSWHGPGCGEILWLSELNAKFPTNLSESQYYQDRLAIVRLGSASAGSIIGYTTSEIPSMDITDTVNSTPGVGTFEPRRLGFPLTSPRRRGDVKLHSYSYDWNAGGGIDYENIKCINIDEVPIPANVHTQFDWDANSRCFIARPPALSWEAYYTLAAGGSPLTWNATTSAANLDLSYSSGVFTANRPMRLNIDASLHLLYSAGTAPFEANFNVERDTGGGYANYRNGYTAITGAAIRHCAVIKTQVDLATDDKIRFTWGPSGGPQTATVSFGDLKLTRSLKA